MRTEGSKNLRTLEFIQHYDQLATRYTDPVEILFKLLRSRKQTIKLQAASILVGYRYPKLMAQKIEIEAAGQMVLGWHEPKPGELIAPLPIELESLAGPIDEQ